MSHFQRIPMAKPFVASSLVVTITGLGVVASGGSASAADGSATPDSSGTLSSLPVEQAQATATDAATTVTAPEATPVIDSATQTDASTAVQVSTDVAPVPVDETTSTTRTSSDAPTVTDTVSGVVDGVTGTVGDVTDTVGGVVGAVTDPGATDPGTTDPGTTDPGTTDPGTTDPGTTDPGTTDPGQVLGGSDGANLPTAVDAGVETVTAPAVEVPTVEIPTGVGPVAPETTTPSKSVNTSAPISVSGVVAAVPTGAVVGSGVVPVQVTPRSSVAISSPFLQPGQVPETAHFEAPLAAPGGASVFNPDTAFGAAAGAPGAAWAVAPSAWIEPAATAEAGKAGDTIKGLPNTGAEDGLPAAGMGGALAVAAGLSMLLGNRQRREGGRHRAPRRSILSI